MPKRTAHILEDKWRSDDVKLQEEADFSSLLLSDRVLLGLKKAGFKTPSPIQVEAIPIGRFGNDLIVQAKSGTGKTLVFTVIALEFLKDTKNPQALILAPTREIAFQICDVINSVGSGFKYLKCAAFIGGIPIENDRQSIVGCQIVVGTPGRIKQLLSLKILHSNSIHLLVLDEADQLLENSFKNDIDSIFVSLPKEKQIITTSATYPKTLKKLAARYFRANPFLARLNVNDLALLGTLHYIHIVEVNQMPVLAYRAKMRALEDVLTTVNFSQCLVFCNVLSKVETICDDIKSWGFSSTYISSGKEQAARLKAIECLKRFKCKVLVSSDITSRGIDAENVDLIINIDLPYTVEVYLHRVGRAGRYGSKGLAVTFVSPNEVHSFKKIQLVGNFKSYFLPDPIPANLINQQPDPKGELLKDEESVSENSDDEPSSLDNRTYDAKTIKHQVANGKGKSAKIKQKSDPKAEILKDEESVSESSNEEPSSQDNISSDSRTVIDPVEHVSNGTEKSATVIQNEILFMNFLNSIENNAVKDNKDLVDFQSDEVCMSANCCTDELMPFDESSGGTEMVEVMQFQGKKSSIIEVNTVKDNKGLVDMQSEEICMSKNSCAGEMMPIDESSGKTKEVLQFKANDTSEETNGAIGKNSDKIAKTNQTTENNNLNFLEILDTSSEEFFMSEDFCKDKLDLMTFKQTQDKDITESTSSSSEFPIKYEIKEDLQLSQEEFDSNEEVVSLDRSRESEESNESEEENGYLKEILFNNANEVEVTALQLDNKHTDPSDRGTGVLTIAESVSNDAEKWKLNENVELKADKLCEAVEQSSLDKENVVPVTTNIAINPVQVDEVTACVVNFINNYEKKTTDGLNGNSVAVEPIKSNSSDPKSLVHELVSDRTRLNDYYCKVFQAYRNENIVGDTSEILELIQDANKMSPADKKDELCSIAETENDVIPNSNKIDLSSWSMKLAVNKVELDSTEESTDSSSDCIFESTPVKISKFKAKNTQLDVSSDTPSFLNVVEDPETDDSTNSEYSNKCSKLENAFKNKIRTGNKGRATSNHSSATESTSSSSDTEDSTSSGGTTEVTLLEKAHKEMVESNGKKQTLGEKAFVLRRVLHGLESKIPLGQISKESISGIQITTATHSSKVHDNKSASNDEYSLHGIKTKKSFRKSSSSLTSLLSQGDVVSVKKSTDSGCSSSKYCGKNVNRLQGKYRRFSLSSKTSSDDSESSASYSGASNCSEKRKRSKAAKRKTRSKTPIQCHQESFASAGQGNFHVRHPQNSSQVNNSFFSHHGDCESSVHSSHAHDISCYMPSQHQCYSLNSRSSCQSQFCATWYDMFYRQWYFIQQSSYFQ